MDARRALLFAIVTTAFLTTTPGLRAADPPAAPALCGHWSGYWESCTTRHHGPLHGTFTQTDPTHYRVVFTGRFFKVIPFRYAQTLEVTGYQDGAVILSGSSRLPLFGTFEYRATATGTDFVATYQSRSDQGKFILKRCR